MLQAYLITIIICFVMNFSALVVFAANIRDNGWTTSKYNRNYTPRKALLMFVCTCAIPVIRVMFLVAIFIMASMTPDEFDELKKK